MLPWKRVMRPSSLPQLDEIILTTLRNRQGRYPAMWQANLGMLASVIAAVLPPYPGEGATREARERWFDLVGHVVERAEFSMMEDVVGQDEPFSISA